MTSKKLQEITTELQKNPDFPGIIRKNWAESNFSSEIQ